MTLTINEVVARTTSRIPHGVSWTPDEPYGPHGIDDWEAPVVSMLYCVTPTPAVVSYFRERGHSLLISHHPYVIPSIPQLVFHTALDCCEGGLNDMWRDGLGLQDARHIDGTLGWVGRVEPLGYWDLWGRVLRTCGPPWGDSWIDRGRLEGGVIRSVAVCSGLGGYVADLALATGADAYVTGELLCPARDVGFPCVIETGHTASEAMGVKLFRDILPGIKVELAPFGLDRCRGETFGPNWLVRSSRT